MRNHTKRVEYTRIANLFAQLTESSVGLSAELNLACFTRPDLGIDVGGDIAMLTLELEVGISQEPPWEAISFIRECLSKLGKAGQDAVAVGAVGLTLSIGVARDCLGDELGRAVGLSSILVPTFRILVAGPELAILRSAIDEEASEKLRIRQIDKPVIGVRRVLRLERGASLEVSGAAASISELWEKLELLTAWFRCKPAIRAFAYWPGGFAVGSRRKLADGTLLDDALREVGADSQATGGLLEA